jgi:hypothetical protein
MDIKTISDMAFDIGFLISILGAAGKIKKHEVFWMIVSLVLLAISFINS